MDSTRKERRQALAGKMRIREPILREGEYEVRIWNRCELCYGEAHVLYRLIKRKETFTVSKYTIRWNKYEFEQAKKFKPPRPATIALWNKLTEQNILILPDEFVIHDQLFPKPGKDSTWNVIEADGTVSVKAKIRRESWMLIGDGESYYFQVFSKDNYHDYGYSNPLGYMKGKPEIAELKNVVSILNELSDVFQFAK